MAKLDAAIDLDDIDLDDDDFSPIPIGWYTGQITGSEIKDTQANDGSHYIQLTIEILSPEYSSRLVWDRLNIKNKNPQAESIAKKNLKALCDGLGIKNLTDTEELHGKPFSLKLGIQPAKDEYPASNTVKGYKKAGGAVETSGDHW